MRNPRLVAGLVVFEPLRDPLPAASLAGALSLAQAQRNQFRKEVIALQQQLESQQNASAVLRQTLESEVIALQQQLESQQNESAVLRQTLESREKEIDWVLECINTTEQEVKSLREEKAEWETCWKAVENSAGWRMLNAWRRVRDLLAPTSTQRRKPTTRYKEFP